MKWGSQREKSLHLHIHFSIIHNSQDGNNLDDRQQINEWRKCDVYLYIIWFNHKKKKPFAAPWKDFLVIILSEISQKTKDKNSYVESKNNELIERE